MSVISVFIASPEGGNGRNVVANGVASVLSHSYKTQIYRPATDPGEKFTAVLLRTAGSKISAKQATATTSDAVRANQTLARGDVARGYHTFCDATQPEACVLVGRDASRIAEPEAAVMDARFAADTQSVVMLAVCTLQRDAGQLRSTVLAYRDLYARNGVPLAGVFVTGCKPNKEAQSLDVLSDLKVPVWTLPPMDCTNDEEAACSLPVFHDHAPAHEVLAACQAKRDLPVTPYFFQNDLIARARRHHSTIVVPESLEPRMLRAANYLLERDVVDILFVGERDDILAAGADMGLEHLEMAKFHSLHDERLLVPMVDELVRLRSKKGMTEQKARETLKDPTYFGTMLVQLDQADGLVSGSINSTANTVRPALQVIKTAPGASMVSGAFLMCLPTHVAVFADCAITPNPTAEQLADIALQSAATARAFGIEPRVGMLSYSTLGSGKGPDVDLVTEATRIVHEKEPDLAAVGPIQFDAAWSPEVAATKAPGNDVAGHVNVFVFPDLSAGNIGYKAVQRSSGAVAIGPVLQGLRRPVNDLSRGATVPDIINTIALTAVCAHQ